MKILIDGPISGTYSLSIVNREFAKALILLGQDVFVTQREGPNPLEDAYFLKEKILEGKYIPYTEIENQEFDIHSKNDWPVFGTPKHAPYLVSHCYAWEETTFPTNIAIQLEKFDAIFTTSEFTSTALRASGYTGQVSCIGNGVDHLHHPSRNSKDRNKPGLGFKFLHISSGLERKGMDAGIKAFLKEFSSENNVKLIIKTHYNETNIIYKILDGLEQSDRKKIDLIEEELSQEELHDLISEADFCFFPSRGEGFLLPAAEAMLIGTPVCATECGGNEEFCTSDTALMIPTKLQRARSHVTAGKSAWFEATEDDIRQSLRHARNMSQQERKKLVASAKEAIIKYTWATSAEKFLLQINLLRGKTDKIAGSFRKNGDKTIKIVSTFNQRCGIATYSENLVHHMRQSGLKPEIISEVTNEIVSLEEDTTRRCWIRGNNFNKDIYQALNSDSTTDILILQHHPGIISWDQLTKLVKQVRPFISKIIIELHSTAGNSEQIQRFTDVMKISGTIIVHNSSDYIKLVSGLSDSKNILLLPHPVEIRDAPRKQPEIRDIEIFAFGICLPHKQFEVISKLVYHLRSRGHRAKAKVITSIAQGQEKSIKYAHDLWLYKTVLGLDDDLTFIFDFLPIDQVLDVASSCNVAIFPYAEVNEGASGAARVALNAELPVIVSNSTIFDDMDGICKRFDMEDIYGIAEEILVVSKDAKSQLEKQDDYMLYSSWEKHIERLCIIAEGKDHAH